jgi:hypothetical protein
METLDERKQLFRQTLVKEMFGDQLWYHKTKEKNIDIIVFHPECPYKTAPNGRVAEHRYIWWLNHPDEPIEYHEEIHHINGNHQDNRIENLEKVNHRNHARRHMQMKSKSDEIPDKPNSAIQKEGDI